MPLFHPMSTVNIGINGLGRIGRVLLREFCLGNNGNLRLAAVNALARPETTMHLIKYDSIHGRFPIDDIDVEEHCLKVRKHRISYHRYKDPLEIPWPKDNVDIVIDATGSFQDQHTLGKHKRGSVKKVILCAPGKDVHATFVMGINHQTYDPKKHHIVSNASCTTNCLAPMAKVIEDSFSIVSGFMTTIHSYTGDQRLLDKEHADPRRARAAALSMIPTTTGAARAIGEVIPSLKGKLDGFAVRIPTPNVSMTDLTCFVEKPTTVEDVNKAFEEASKRSLQGILHYEREKLVSVDYIGMKESSCIDASLTSVIGSKTVKTVSWYDNEVGFSNRVLDLASYMGRFFS